MKYPEKRVSEQELGMIVSGSLSNGLVMRFSHSTLVSHIKAGMFLSIETDAGRIFSMVSDLQLESTTKDVILFPPFLHETMLRQVLQDNVYATALLRPLIMVTTRNTIAPVKTIPPHFATVKSAQQEDISIIFGKETDTHKSYFNVGTPLDMQVPICIDLDKFMERSNGIFGKTGTGKTFLTRLMLTGILQKQKGVAVIFDMHSEYGHQARKEGSTQFVKGLKALFPGKVAVASLDPQATRRRGQSADIPLTIPYSALSVEDVISLQEELNLHSTACEAAYLLAAKYHKNWLQSLLEAENIKDLASEIGAHPESLAALYRKLKPIQRLSCFTAGGHSNIVDDLVSYLDRGISLIIEFGNFTSTLCYLLVANVISRALHQAYVEKTERFLANNAIGQEPQKLLIVIEEAHKFLNPVAARQTIFGIIAREMRKYYVSLLVIDQRPSGIDPEIISQLGTKIIAQLNDERDIQTALHGAHNAHHLKVVLASLESKKQVLMMGHALPMPVVIETRAYDEELYRQVMESIPVKNVSTLIEEIF
jgi:uncharacterized protein